LIRQHIGIVPQESAIYDDLSARENLDYFGRLYGMHGSSLRDRVEVVLQAIGLSDRASRRVGTFSGGMKRRLNLGVAIVHEPKLLLLDEPTTGVDPQSRNHLFDEIRRINEMGMTIIYTSHYVGEVESLCKRVAIMDNGRLVACDDLDAMMRHVQSVIRFRVTPGPEPLVNRLASRTNLAVRTMADDSVEIECPDMKTTLIQVLTMLNDLQLGLVSLETEEPNLEHVFLHLTGKALRD
jgi:ABC-2 type transport system ATP-binding protein